MAAFCRTMNTRNYLPSTCTKTICKCNNAFFTEIKVILLNFVNSVYLNLNRKYFLRISHMMILLCRLSAKFLWKRIPLTAKSAAAELEAIWKVGKAMQRKDYDSIYSSLRHSWSPDISPLMQLVEGMRLSLHLLIS